MWIEFLLPPTDVWTEFPLPPVAAWKEFPGPDVWTEFPTPSAAAWKSLPRPPDCCRAQIPQLSYHWMDEIPPATSYCLDQTLQAS